MTDLASIEQNTPEWLAARAGSLGASAVHDVIAKTKSGPAASRAACLARLVIERLTGEPAETFRSAAMRDGQEREPQARAAYEFEAGVDVQTVGLFQHPRIKFTHASPDGIVGDIGLVEIKCPQPAQHLATLDDEPIAARYLTQMQWQMACTGRLWCDFVSFNPSFPDGLQLYVQRVARDADRIAELEAEVTDFLGEVTAKVARLRARFVPDIPILAAG